MKYVLGIDSGGTKFKMKAADLSGHLLAEYAGPCSSHYVVGIDGAQELIASSVSACLKLFNGQPDECAALVCGTTGWDSDEDGDLINGFYQRLPGFFCPIRCMNDVELAFYTVLGETGVLALAGTGSIFYGRNTAGREARVGGWPKGLMGEEGSGRYIDALALRHYSRCLDGCRPVTELTNAIAEVVGGRGRKELMTYSETVLKPDFSTSNLTPLVNRAAESGDPWAADILRQAATALIEPLEDLIDMLNMNNDPALSVGLWGGVILNCRIYREEFRRLLTLRHPGTAIVLPQKDAAQGAVEWALRIVRSGISWQDH